MGDDENTDVGAGEAEDRKRPREADSEAPAVEASDSAADEAAAEERRKRREKRRAMAWDKDAHGNPVAPSPAVLAVASGALPVAAAFTAHAHAGPSLLQQQAGLTRRARRLHIGSLPPGCTIAFMKELFNDSLLRAGLTINGAASVINDVQMDAGGKFAFIEFRSVREATSALALDGLVVLGRTIRVQRPNDFVVPPVELHDVLIPAGTVPAAVLPLATPAAHAQMPGLPLLPAAGLASLYAVAPPPTGNVADLLNSQMLSGMTASNPAAAQQTASQISRKARRLHIGNLPQGVGITPAMMAQFFSATLIATGLIDASKSGDPVVDCTLNSNGKFAFVEFRTIAEATSALTLNNVELGGRQLRVERPRDYQCVPASVLPELDRFGFVGETPICNMQQLIEHAHSGGVAMPLGALPGGAASAAPMYPPLPGQPPAGAYGVPPPPPQPAAAALVVDESKRVIGLSSMVTDVELADDQECRDILDDAKTECAKSGVVDGILLLRAGESGPVGTQGDKVIFVRFEAPAAAANAARALHGKRFDGRVVAATFHPDETYDALLLSPHHTC
jgi:splicing factor U2AF subunit